MPRKHETGTEPDDVDLMVEVGRAVFGPQWQKPMGRALSVSGALIQVVAARKAPMSADLRMRLGEWAAEERGRQREAVAERLRVLARAEDVFLRIEGVAP